MQYTINNVAAIYDIIDGDIVIIHLENGNYYNISGSGAFIWKQITKNTSYSDLIGFVSSKYDLDPIENEKDLLAFLGQLEDEGLILRQVSELKKSSEDQVAKSVKKKLSYSAPILEIFTDMQDFLLVDPIHEVDEEGLPKYTPPKFDED